MLVKKKSICKKSNGVSCFTPRLIFHLEFPLLFQIKHCILKLQGNLHFHLLKEIVQQLQVFSEVGFSVLLKDSCVEWRLYQ